MSETPEAQLDGFIDKFEPHLAEQARAAVAWMRRRLPGAMVLVYDNYNALAVGFAARDNARSAVLSIAVYPRWVSLFLVGGQAFDDPHGLLKGEGGTMRHLVLKSAADLDEARIGALIDQALARAEPPVSPEPTGRMLIKSISAKQRPRRPG